jgi:hypothetical protein
MNDELPVPFDRLAGALLLEEGWEVSSDWLEPLLGGVYRPGTWVTPVRGHG